MEGIPAFMFLGISHSCFGIWQHSERFLVSFGALREAATATAAQEEEEAKHITIP